MTCSKTDRKRTLDGRKLERFKFHRAVPSDFFFICIENNSDKKKLTFKKYVNRTTRKRIRRILSIAKRKLFNEVGGDRGSMSAYPPDQRQLRIPNVPKSDGRTPVTRQFVQLLETALRERTPTSTKKERSVPARFPRNLIRRAYRRRQER